MTEIDDVGSVTAQCVVDYLSSPQAKDLIARLKTAGVSMESTAELVDERFAGMTFVLTGTLNRFDRKTAQTLIEERGGKAAAGEAAGSKLKKAEELGIPVLTEDEFERLLE